MRHMQLHAVQQGWAAPTTPILEQVVIGWAVLTLLRKPKASLLAGFNWSNDELKTWGKWRVGQDVVVIQLVIYDSSLTDIADVER